MNKEVKELWLAALRSGNYSQGKFRLRNTNDEFCCLGVLCDIFSKQGGVGSWSIPKEPILRSTDAINFETPRGSNAVVPTGEVCDWADLQTNLLTNLSAMNDMGCSFKVIAKFIEKQM